MPTTYRDGHPPLTHDGPVHTDPPARTADPAANPAANPGTPAKATPAVKAATKQMRTRLAKATKGTSKRR